MFKAKKWGYSMDGLEPPKKGIYSETHPIIPSRHFFPPHTQKGYPRDEEEIDNTN